MKSDDATSHFDPHNIADLSVGLVCDVLVTYERFVLVPQDHGSRQGAHSQNK
jgi:hypothetical protein